MQRTIKIFLSGFVLAALGLLSASGFSLLGPALNSDATWQIQAWGYGLTGWDIANTGPKSIGQGYRRNAPVVFYAFDQTFVDFFGPTGMVAVESAFNIMNALTNADKMQLSQFPLNSQQNFDARALDLMDLKSMTLGELMEQMGLDEPVRFDWTLHDRYLPSGGVCPFDEEYLVTQRNIDPVSQLYSAYVNGTLYSYQIDESCGVNTVYPNTLSGAIDAVTQPVSVDTDAQTYTPVAEALDVFGVVYNPLNSQGYESGSLAEGNYYTGLTFDDAGGIRYLYSTNNINVETPAPGSLLEVTNAQLTLLQTSDLGELLQFAQTNPPSVQAEFPNLVIDSYSTYYTIVTNPTVYSYFTNYPGSTAGSPPVFVVGTNGYTLSAQTNYAYIFGNLVIVNYHTNTPALLVTTSLAELIGARAGTGIYTNVTTKKIVLTNVISGDYYLIPPGSCGYGFYKTLVTNYFAGTTTNIIASATNTSSTVDNGFIGTESIVTRFTNDWYEVYGCTFQTPVAAPYQGVGKIQFVEADYDSLIGQYYPPVTNYYTMTMVTNYQTVVQHFQRIVTQPDILLDAADLASPIASQIGISWPPFDRDVTFTLDPQVPGSVPASGPGTITDYPTTISYNDVGPVYFTFGGVDNNYAYLEEVPSEFTWASFDNSTNAPTIYPDGTLQNLENEILLKISPAILPAATNGVAYSQTFTISGGAFTQPYTWSLGTDPVTLQQTQLPTGLYLTPGGTIVGTPNATAGPYDFVLQMTDYNGRTVTWNYSINIDP